MKSQKTISKAKHQKGRKNSKETAKVREEVSDAESDALSQQDLEGSDSFDGFDSDEVWSDSDEDTKSTPSKAPVKERAVVYVGRIPHGFYETEMRKYFSQFGDVKNIRMSRNKRTGASKHYAFLEFETPDVADIVCDTMNNYLLFGHLLKVSRLDSAQISDNLFLGGNRRHTPKDYRALSARRQASKHPREWWDEYATKAEERKASRAAKLRARGIDYEF